MKPSEIVKNSIKKINLQLKKKDKIQYDKNFQILGPKSKLDSLIIVNLFIEIENNIKKISHVQNLSLNNFLSSSFF